MMQLTPSEGVLDTNQQTALLAEAANVSAAAAFVPSSDSYGVSETNISAQASNFSPKKPGLLIRRGVAADREQVRALLRQHHATTVFREQKFSDWKFEAQFDLLIKHPENILALVAEYRGAIVGAAWAQSDHYMLSDGPPFVAVQLIAVEQQALNQVGRTKTFLGLIAAVRQWQAEKSASHVQVHVTTGANLGATDKLLRAAGAECVGGSYAL